MIARYGNDVTLFNRLTIPHPLRERLTAAGAPNETARRELMEDPDALQIRETRPPLSRGKPAERLANGQFPVGTTTVYMVAHRSGPLAVPLVRQADGWKIDLRWWIAGLENARTASDGSPSAVRALLAAMLRLDRARASRLLLDGRTIDYLFLGAPSQREPSGVLEEAAAEMPIVELGPGEFAAFPNDRVVEGGSAADRKVLVGMFGPIEMPFVVHRVGGEWKVVAEPYFALMMQ